MFIVASYNIILLFHKYIIMVQLKGNVMSTQSLLVCYLLTLTIRNSLNFKVGTQSYSIRLPVIHDGYFHKGMQIYLKKAS